MKYNDPFFRIHQEQYVRKYRWFDVVASMWTLNTMQQFIWLRAKHSDFDLIARAEYKRSSFFSPFIFHFGVL